MWRMFTVLLVLFTVGCGSEGRKPAAFTKVTNWSQKLVLQPTGRKKAVAIPANHILVTWEYPKSELTNGLAFEVWHSTDLASGNWSVLARTNTTGLSVPGRLPAEFFVVRAYRWDAGFTNYGPWNSK